MKRTKSQFKCIKERKFSPWLNDYFDYEDYPNLRTGGCHKKFSTLNEAKQAFSKKEDEYRDLYKIRGRRSRKGLPNPWDDYPTYVYQKIKSWKYNSKRKNQWFKEKFENIKES
jgi:hypothetical protein